jgi:hypothetical protein
MIGRRGLPRRLAGCTRHTRDVRLARRTSDDSFAGMESFNPGGCAEAEVLFSDSRLQQVELLYCRPLLGTGMGMRRTPRVHCLDGGRRVDEMSYTSRTRSTSGP